MPTSLGKVGRKVLGPRLFHVVGHYYVNMWGDYRIVARRIIDAIPQGAHILDIGGGDGHPLNHILNERPDVRVTMIDIKPDAIGGAVADPLGSRVTILPRTSMRQYCERGHEPPDVILLLSVMHHIAPKQRPEFLRDLHAIVELNPRMRVIFKDGEPDGSFASKMGYFLCRYVSGDPNTSRIGCNDLIALLRGEFGEAARFTETDLYRVMPPGYVLIMDVPNNGPRVR